MRWLVLILCACAPTLPVASSDWTTVEKAAEIVGVPIEPAREGLNIEWSAVARTDDNTGCRRKVRSPHDPILLAHEIGHALGLDHVGDPANLMHPFVGDDTLALTDEQRDVMASEIDDMTRCP